MEYDPNGNYNLLPTTKHYLTGETYEEFKKNLSLFSQPLLFPLVVELDKSSIDALMSKQADIKKFMILIITQVTILNCGVVLKTQVYLEQKKVPVVYLSII